MRVPHSFAFCANEWEYRDTVGTLERAGQIPLIAENAMSGAHRGMLTES